MASAVLASPVLWSSGPLVPRSGPLVLWSSAFWAWSSLTLGMALLLCFAVNVLSSCRVMSRHVMPRV